MEKAKLIHGDKYNYSLVEYVTCTTKIKIICKIHGSFDQNPSSHVSGQGCSKCYNERRHRCTRENIIERSIAVHRNEYDYSLVEYINVATKIKIICKIHGEFQQLPLHHISVGQGCKKCKLNKCTLTKTEFITKSVEIHGDRYDYSQSEYITTRCKLKIMCKIHGEFEQRPSDHMDGRGCRKCMTDSQKYTKDEFIEECKKIHKDRYDYSLVEYKTNKIKVKILCKKHGIFEQKPNDHLAGTGCPHCINKTEGLVKEFLISNNIKFKTHCSINNRYYDFVINNDYILEIDGRQHFPDMKKQNMRIVGDRKEFFENDIMKMSNIIDYYPIVRLFQEHIWDNKYDWKYFLTNKTSNLQPGTLYIRSEENEIYKGHLLNFKTVMLC